MRLVSLYPINETKELQNELTWRDLLQRGSYCFVELNFKMNAHQILFICTLFNGILALFHMVFWKILHWKMELRTLHPYNRAIVQVLNLKVIYLLICFSACSYIYREELVTTKIGKGVLFAMCGFWMTRIIEQIIFFSNTTFIEKILVGVFIVGAVIHAMAISLSK